MRRATYGAIVEGAYDVGVFEELIKKICPYPVEAWVNEARGRTKLMSNFPRLLRMFEHRTTFGGAVDRGLVIRDSNGKDPAELEKAMRAKIVDGTYGFRYGIEVHALQQETETWLLADPAAISRVAGRQARVVRGPLEQVQQAKEAFMDVLSEAGLVYTPEVCRRIAAEINLGTLRSACPSFGRFEEKVLFS